MTVRSVLVVIVGAAWMAGCSPGTPAEQRGEHAREATGEILVGAAWPWQARQNLLYAQGLDMALDEVNAGGGVRGRKLRLLKEDDQETLDQGRAVAQKLTANPDVVAVIGHLESYITVPASSIYDVAGVLLVAPTSTDPALTEQGYKLVFRTTFTDKQVGSHMATVAVQRGYKRMAIYYMRDRYGRSLANAFEETFSAGGGVVVNRQSYNPSESVNARQVDSLVDEWKGRDLSAVFVAGEAPQAAAVMASAKGKGLNIPFLGGDALGTPELFGGGDGPVEGVTLVSPFHPDNPRPEVQQFDKAFQQRFNRRPDTAAALAYDSLRLLAEGMRKAPSTAPTEIAAALHTLGAWRGVTGGFAFAQSGDLGAPPLVTVVAKKGKFAFLSNGERTDSSLSARAASAP